MLIADDHFLVIEGMVDRLRREPSIEVVATAANGDAAVKLVRQLLPHVVLMDVSMPVLDGIEATRLIASEFPWVRIIGLSMHDDPATERKMREAGAVDYINKGTVAADLVDAIHRAAGVPLVSN